MGYVYSKDNIAPSDYFIYKKGSNIACRDNSTGNVLYNDSDFSTVIQAVLDDIDTIGAGRKIVIGSGTFTVSSTIELKKYVAIYGMGYSHSYGPTMLTLANGVDDDMFHLDAGSAVTTSVSLNELYLTGNKANNAAGSGINFTANSQSNTIKNVVVGYFKEYGIKIGRGYETQIFSNLIKSNDISGIYTSGDGGNVIFGNIISGNTQYGVHTTNSYNIIQGNYFTYNAYGGVYLHINNLCSNNMFALNTGSAYNATIAAMSIQNVICGNHINCSSNYGIYLSHSDNIVSGNMIKGATVTTVYNNSGSRSTINNIGKESDNAEEPQLEWEIGAIVQFTDTGDASGDGLYIKNQSGTWVKID